MGFENYNHFFLCVPGPAMCEGETGTLTTFAMTMQNQPMQQAAMAGGLMDGGGGDDNGEWVGGARVNPRRR